MTIIQCKSGATSQSVGGRNYEFTRDSKGRYVCEVGDLVARSVFLSVSDHYCELNEVIDFNNTKIATESDDDLFDEDDEEDGETDLHTDDEPTKDSSGSGENVTEITWDPSTVAPAEPDAAALGLPVPDAESAAEVVEAAPVAEDLPNIGLALPSRTTRRRS